MNDDQLLRYSRHLLLPEVDVEGQEKLLNARVLLIGLGGLGSPIAMYLTAAGVGELVIVDHDHVELSNLQRQIIHRTRALGQPKAESAAEMLWAMNPDTRITAINHKLDEEQLLEQARQADLIIDATDNFTTRHAINRVSVATSTPLVSGAAIRFEGQITVFDRRQVDSPCYHCLYPDNGNENLSCSESGVISPLVGIIGSMQALEAVKLIMEQPTLHGRLMVFDGLYTQWQTLNLQRDTACPVCSDQAE